MQRLEYLPIVADSGLPYPGTAPPQATLQRLSDSKYWDPDTQAWVVAVTSFDMTEEGDIWIGVLPDLDSGVYYRATMEAGGPEFADACYTAAVVLTADSAAYYISYADVDEEIIDLDRLIPEGKATVAWVTTHIRNAQRMVDAQLLAVAATPYDVDVVPDIVKDITLLYACYRILRPNYVKDDPSVSDWVDQYKKDADALMKSILEGKIPLATTERAGALSSTLNNTREFTRTLKGSDGDVLETGSTEVW